MANAFGVTTAASGTSVHSITHTLGTSAFYLTALCPAWNTTVWTGSKNTVGATIYFGTQVTSGGGVLSWRAET